MRVYFFFPTNSSLPLMIKHKAITEHITSHPWSAFSSQSIAKTFKPLSDSNGKKGISTLQANVALSLLPACNYLSKKINWVTLKTFPTSAP